MNSGGKRARRPRRPGTAKVRRADEAPRARDGGRLIDVTLVVAIFGLLTAGVAPASEGVEAGRAHSLGQITDQYRDLDREDAVAAVGLLTQREIEEGAEALLKAVEATARGEHSTRDDETPGEPTLLAAAALLTDAAGHALYQGNSRRTRFDLGAAARLVRATRSAGGSSGFTRRFHLVAGVMLHAMADLPGAFAMLSEGRRQAKDDPELLVALGAVSETIASLRTYELRDETRRRAGSRDERKFVVEGEAGEGGTLPHASLADAQALYVRALQRDPDLLEARLRLGRVLLLRDRPGEALPELERVERESLRPTQRCLASLFEGRARERLGDPRGAAVAFGAAVDRAPRARSALVALGRALDRLGEGTRAQEVFDRALQPGAAGGHDPWLDYILGQPGRIDTLLEGLRSLVP